MLLDGHASRRSGHLCQGLLDGAAVAHEMALQKCGCFHELVSCTICSLTHEMSRCRRRSVYALYHSICLSSIDWHTQSRFQPQWPMLPSVPTLDPSVAETRHTGNHLPPGSLSKIFTHLPLQCSAGAPCVCSVVSIFCSAFMSPSVHPQMCACTCDTSIASGLSTVQV